VTLVAGTGRQGRPGARRHEGRLAPFSDGSADQLRDLLKALAVFAVSGVEGLKAMVGATDKTAALPAAAVLLSCLTGTRAPKSDDETPADDAR